MEERLLNAKINSLSEDYGFRPKQIKKYYSFLAKYPFIEQGDDNQALECLEMIVQDRIVNTVESDLKRTVFDSVEEAVYRVYDEKAIGYLSEKFIRTREIEQNTNNDISLIKAMENSYTDGIYNGYR